MNFWLFYVKIYYNMLFIFLMKNCKLKWRVLIRFRGKKRKIEKNVICGFCC